jgi:beta-glucosidase/6-phospho-beta-glucosidase/beta-galactosidase
MKLHWVTNLRWLIGLVGMGVVVACSSDEKASTPDPNPEIVYKGMGSLASGAGKGSFRFGAASAATQIEDQNTKTDWYLWTQPKAEGGLARSEFVGQASQGFSKAIADIELIKSLGLDSYRFSMEWARIEPERNKIDEAALEHYSKFIDALLAAGIRPLVTIHHFSNPVWIDDPRDPECTNGPSDTNLCGFGHPTGGAMVVKELAEHAALLAQRFGDRVDEWATINEPVNYLVASHGIGMFPPGKSKITKESALLGEFIPTVRDFIDAHAAIYDAIKTNDTKDADGDGSPADVGLTLSVAEWVPSRDNEVSTNPEDVAAADRIRYVYHYLFIDSILNGNFDTNLDGQPDETHDTWKSRLDWLGVQYYFRTGVTGKGGLIPVVKATPCFGKFDFGSCIPPLDQSHFVPDMGYEYYPEGLYNVLKDFSKRWQTLPLVVTEGGIATNVGSRRAENIVRSLEQIEKARTEGADIRGYYHWSLFDNFEWAEGFKPHFGLFQVDYTTFERKPTAAVDVYKSIIQQRKISSSQRVTYGGEGAMTLEPGSE